MPKLNVNNSADHSLIVDFLEDFVRTTPSLPIQLELFSLSKIINMDSHQLIDLINEINTAINHVMPDASEGIFIAVNGDISLVNINPASSKILLLQTYESQKIDPDFAGLQTGILSDSDSGLDVVQELTPLSELLLDFSMSEPPLTDTTVYHHFKKIYYADAVDPTRLVTTSDARQQQQFNCRAIFEKLSYLDVLFKKNKRLSALLFEYLTKDFHAEWSVFITTKLNEIQAMLQDMQKQHKHLEDCIGLDFSDDELNNNIRCLQDGIDRYNQKILCTLKETQEHLTQLLTPTEPSIDDSNLVQLYQNHELIVQKNVILLY